MNGFIDVHAHVVLEESMGAAGPVCGPELDITPMEPHSFGLEIGV